MEQPLTTSMELLEIFMPHIMDQLMKEIDEALIDAAI